MNMGEVLELMLGARHRLRTLRATAHWWTDPDGWRRALDRHAEHVRTRGRAFGIVTMLGYSVAAGCTELNRYDVYQVR